MGVTRITTVQELKQIFIQALLNTTDKVSKISDDSVLNGVAYGTSKIGQKVLKEISLVENQLFPDDAFGEGLDVVASFTGISPRFGNSASSTFLRLVGAIETVYEANTHIFSGGGVNFELTEDVTIGESGFIYAKVRSQLSGIRVNVPSLTINTVNPVPDGHQFVTNEYESLGGRDVEDDNSFRLRIKEGRNVAAVGTLEYITQVFKTVNSDILQVYAYGVNDQNQTILSISTQNGIDLTENELSELLDSIKTRLSLGDYNGVTNNSINVELRNVENQFIDMNFRVELIDNSRVTETRIGIQIAISKYFDFRYWDPNDRVEWDELLSIVKSIENVRYVPDSFFSPNTDTIIDPAKRPRLRGFIMSDLQGNVLVDTEEVINPIYYTGYDDINLQKTVL